MSGVEPAPIVAYLRIRRAVGVTGPSGARDPSTFRVSQDRTRPARNGTTSDSPTSRELPVLHSRTATTCSRNRAREAAASTAIPPMECPATTAFSPPRSVFSSTASRSSASASVLCARAAGLRP